MSLINGVLKHDASRAIIAKAAGRQTVNSINFMLIAAASAMLRQEQSLNSGADVDEAMDEYNKLINGQLETADTERRHDEMGFGDGISTVERCKMLKSIREYINNGLLEHANVVHFELRNINGPDPFEVGDPIETTLTRQINRAPRELTPAMKKEALALGLPEESILAGLQRQQQANALFLNTNRRSLMEIIQKLEIASLDEDSAEAMFDKLPVMDRFRLYAAADNGLYYAAINQGQRYVVFKVQEGKDNLAIINAERINLRKVINAFLAEAHNKRAIADALSSGATPPVLQPLPPTEAEIKKQMAAGATTK